MALGVIVLLVLYVLSFGPVAWLIPSSGINVMTAYPVFSRVYFPLFWLAKKVKPFGDFLEWYIDLWLS